MRGCPDHTATKKELVAKFGGVYYCNGSKHLGEVLSRMVKSGHLIRIKPGVYKVENRAMRLCKPQQETTIFEKMIFGGIDPAARAYGFAVCLIDYEAMTATFTRLKEPGEFFSMPLPEKALWAVEHSGLLNATFLKSSNQRLAARLSRNAGANQMVSSMVVKHLQGLYGKAAVMAVAPNKKGMVLKNETIIRAAIAAEGLTIFAAKKLVEDDFVAFHMAKTARNNAKKCLLNTSPRSTKE